jgi:hypothetical protein
MGAFFTIFSSAGVVFLFELLESIEYVEFVRAKLLVELMTIEPFDFAFNLFLVTLSEAALFASKLDFEESVETLDGCRKLRDGTVSDARMISLPRDEIATVTLSDFCSDFFDW